MPLGHRLNYCLKPLARANNNLPPIPTTFRLCLFGIMNAVQSYCYSTMERFCRRNRWSCTDFTKTRAHSAMPPARRKRSATRLFFLLLDMYKRSLLETICLVFPCAASGPFYLLSFICCSWGLHPDSLVRLFNERFISCWMYSIEIGCVSYDTALWPWARFCVTSHHLMWVLFWALCLGVKLSFLVFSIPHLFLRLAFVL